jgi:cardiolipin synthase
LIAICLLQAGFGLGVPGLKTVMIWCVAVTTLASGAAYVWNTARGE